MRKLLALLTLAAFAAGCSNSPPTTAPTPPPKTDVPKTPPKGGAAMN